MENEESQPEQPQEKPQRSADNQSTGKKSHTPLLIAAVLAAIIAIVFLLPSEEKDEGVSETDASRNQSESKANTSASPDATKTPDAQTSTKTSQNSTSTENNANLVILDSNPTGADVFIDDALIGTTPHQMKVDAKKGQSVTLKLDGYEPRELKLSVDNPKPTIRLVKSKTKKKNTKRPLNSIKSKLLAYVPGDPMHVNTRC